MEKNRKNISSILLRKASVFSLINLMAFVVLLMSYKPRSLDDFDSDSVFVYFSLGKSLFLVVLFALVLILVAKWCLLPCLSLNFRLYASICPIIFLLLYIAASEAWNVSQIYASASLGIALFNLTQFLTIYLLLYFTKKKLRIQVFASFLAYLSFLLVITVIPEAFSVPLGTRLVGLAGNSTAFGSFSALGLISVVYLNAARGKSSFLFSCLQVVFLLSAVLSGSRNVLISLFLSLLVYVGCSYRRTPKGHNSSMRCLKWCAIIAASIAVMYAASSNLFTLFTRDDLPEHSRSIIWAIVYTMYIKGSIFTKLFGNGYGFLKDTFRSAHNTYLQILVEYGTVYLVVLLCYLAYIFRCIIKSLTYSKKSPDNAYLASLMVFVCIFSISLNVLFVGIFSICYVVLCFIISALVLDKYDSNTFVCQGMSVESRKQ